MVRAEWLNLNGTWEFGETDDGTDVSWLSEKAFPDKIVVPFCRESKLSGLGRTGFIRNVWYRRTFQRPADWKSQRTRLHIGACDWKATVWLNGQKIGEHTGGNAPFCFDVTDALVPGDNTVIIHAFDDTRSGIQALGKQATSEKSSGVCYTRVTGIWQTVWLEGVGESFLSNVRIDADPKQSRVFLQPEVLGSCEGLTFRATALNQGKIVGVAETPADWRNNRLVLSLQDKRLWSIEDPFLYDLKLQLLQDGKPIDEVQSYFGLREVSIHGAAILLNDKPVFQRMVLDQGYYPDGIWTAPNDEALRNDIKLSQEVGFNGARLHQKVFEPRYLYWADRMGYIVWGEFPNSGLSHRNPNSNLPVIGEWTELLQRDRNHPAIIGWCPFNETCPEAEPLQKVMFEVTKAIDPSRPVIESSGWYHSVAIPDILDYHDYEWDPATLRSRWTVGANVVLPKRYGNTRLTTLCPTCLSEFGGIWSKSVANPDAFHERFKGMVDAQLDNPRVFGYCYTQLTDVEQEQNGLYTYDRKPKFDVARLHAVHTNLTLKLRV